MQFKFQTMTVWVQYKTDNEYFTYCHWQNSYDFTEANGKPCFNITKLVTHKFISSSGALLWNNDSITYCNNLPVSTISPT